MFRAKRTLVLVVVGVVDDDDNESCRAHVSHVSSLKRVFTLRKVGLDTSFFLPLKYVIRRSETFIDMVPLVFTTVHAGLELGCAWVIGSSSLQHRCFATSRHQSFPTGPSTAHYRNHRMLTGVAFRPLSHHKASIFNHP